MSDRLQLVTPLPMSERLIQAASVLASAALWRLLVAGILSAALWGGAWWALRA